MVPIHKKAWAAGIVDGEGNIARRKASKNTTCIMVRVDNTNRKMLEELSRYFGGNIYINNRKNKPNSKPCFYWRLVCRKAEYFLRQILPYLVAKQDLAIRILN